MDNIFDGKAFARRKEDELYHKIVKLGKRPVIASILVGEEPASRLYVNLKRAAADRVGAEMDVYEFSSSISYNQLIKRISLLNEDKTVTGIMVQLPLPERLKGRTNEILSHIDFKKDVDGLRKNSPFMPAVVRAVIAILNEAKKKVKVNSNARIVVVGAKGAVGEKLVEVLTKEGYKVRGLSRGLSLEKFKKETLAADVLISATGQHGIIKGEHVSKGVVVIDVGSPKGDVDFAQVCQKASFITPVPGGVGPVTVVSLLENLLDLAVNN